MANAVCPNTPSFTRNGFCQSLDSSALCAYTSASLQANIRCVDTISEGHGRPTV